MGNRPVQQCLERSRSSNCLLSRNLSRWFSMKPKGYAPGVVLGLVSQLLPPFQLWRLRLDNVDSHWLPRSTVWDGASRKPRQILPMENTPVLNPQGHPQNVDMKRCALPKRALQEGPLCRVVSIQASCMQGSEKMQLMVKCSASRSQRRKIVGR